MRGAMEKAAIFALNNCSHTRFWAGQSRERLSGSSPASRPPRMTSCQAHFHAVLKSEFGPKLRELGFKGSGQNYRRLIGDVIHAINIQGNRWGGSCTVNLGIHVTFLPDTLNKMRDPATFNAINCEFHRRIADDSTSDGITTPCRRSGPRTATSRRRRARPFPPCCPMHRA